MIISKLKKLPDFASLPGATVEQITTAEQTLGVHFAKEYKELLKECSIVSAGVHEFTGICSSKRLSVVVVTEEERNNLIPNSMYAIERTGMDGIVIWQNEKGEVFQSCPGHEPEKICNSISEYIDL